MEPPRWNPSAPGASALLVAAAALVLAPARPARAQDDVALVGRAHGTVPPAAYRARRAADPGAYEFRRAWKGRNPRYGRRLVPGEGPLPVVRGGAAAGPARIDGTGSPAAASTLGPREGGVRGTFSVPLVLGYYGDGTPPDPAVASRSAVQRELFDGPNSRHATIPEFYREVSAGRIALDGRAFGWLRSGLTAAEVTGGESGLNPSTGRVGDFIVDLLAGLEGSVDWGAYDNDGPDGVPNSGDDDGYVDVLAVLQPGWGAECGGPGSADVVWSHRWTIGAWRGGPWVTTSPSAAGGTIRIDDYTIQPALSCDGGGINEIGVFAHELGHAFGLPDLYATGASSHAGIGGWGLMGHGAWGCDGRDPARPCHMSAWSKAVLGWVDVETLPPSGALGEQVLDPVETSARILRVDAGDGSGDHFLLENRQPTGFDGSLPGSGLLVWHVDGALLEERWAANRVNADPTRLSVWLRQADGADELATPGGDAGDGGDPWPGSAGATAFHAGSSPSSWTHAGASAGLTLTAIREVSGRVSFDAHVGHQVVTVLSEGDAGDRPLRVDGTGVASGYAVRSAPFESHVLEAAGGSALGDGVRVAFLEWVDDPEAGRVREWVTGTRDTVLTARYGGREMRLGLALEGGRYGVAPGSVSAAPGVPLEADGFWFPEGTVASLTAAPAPGFTFDRWSGALDGQPNPAVVRMDAPLDAGASFAFTYGLADPVEHALVASVPQSLQLAPADGGTEPSTWTLVSGALPPGLALSSKGAITGAALEAGVFTAGVHVRDARGLEATGTLRLDVAEPVLGADRLAAAFLLLPEGLTPLEEAYLDRAGNDDGAYDLGDFRAWVLAHPGLPAASAAAEALVRSVLPVVRLRPGGTR